MDPKVGVLNWPPSAWSRKALLLVGLIMILVLSACLPAATPSPNPAPTPTPGAPPGADQGKPTSGGIGDTSSQASGGVATPDKGGEAPGARPIVDQTYQWVGVVVVNMLEGQHLELKRDCDTWVLLAQSDENARKLEENTGNRVVVWGRVFTGPSIYMRQAIAVQSAFGPKDPMPMTLVAIPEYPCPGTPTPKPIPPVQPVTLLPGELAARGNLVWEQGRPRLSTPAGQINLTLAPQAQSVPGETTPAPDASARPASLDVVAAGKWRLLADGLELSAHTVRPWPVSVVTKNPCGGQISIEPLQPGEIAARGELVWDAGSPLLKTQYGPIRLSLLRQARDTVATPQPIPPAQSGEAIVLGKWKLAPGQLHLAARQLQMLNLPCPPPPPEPGPSLLPGEITAIGTLVWEGGQPYLDTPSGRILLLISADVKLPTLEPSPPTGTEGTSTSLVQRQVIAVGKWSIKNGQLVIGVRYLRPWPGPVPVEPVPAPTPLPRPMPTPPRGPAPTPGQGTIYGKVRIGPLCPVEPCPSPQSDVYSSRALVLQPEAGGAIYAKLNPDGSFKALVNAGVYSVSLTNCTFLGCKNALPKKVTVVASQSTLIDIDIDTGIR